MVGSCYEVEKAEKNDNQWPCLSSWLQQQQSAERETVEHSPPPSLPDCCRQDRPYLDMWSTAFRKTRTDITGKQLTHSRQFHGRWGVTVGWDNPAPFKRRTQVAVGFIFWSMFLWVKHSVFAWFLQKRHIEREPRKDIKQNYLVPMTHKGLPCDGHTAAIQKLGNYGRGNVSHFMA